MNNRWILAAVALLTATGGCASGGGRGDGPPGRGAGGEQGGERGGPASGLNQSRMLLATAREIQGERGCATAVPTYRVVASFGEGYDVAQYELGACLLEMTVSGGAEAPLFREEGLLWLKRAAWAGNGRAQQRLANLLSGAGYDLNAGVAPDPQMAMGWALVYQENPARSLYALPDLPEPVIEHLRASLTPSALHEAESFAENFTEINLAGFNPPASPQNAGRAQGGRRPQRLDGSAVAPL